jgi:hypothetical protein
MSLPPALLALRDELERLDYVVVEHRDHLCVRFPLLSHVRIFLKGDRLACEARFGMLPRGRASVLAFGVVATIAFASLALQGVTTFSVTYIALTVLGAVYNLARYVTTENCITRVQVLWAMHHGPPRWPPRGIGIGDATPALGEAAPEAVVQPRVETRASGRPR